MAGVDYYDLAGEVSVLAYHRNHYDTSRLLKGFRCWVCSIERTLLMGKLNRKLTID